MNAISFLIKEHDKTRKTFKKISEGSQRFATKRKLLEGLCHDLILHEKMEHEVWYPNFKNDKKVKTLVRHLISEEKEEFKKAKQLKKIKSDEEWEEAFEEFRTVVEHHASQEESELFPSVREILDERTLKDIGKEMRDFRHEHMSEVL